ncbi:hypothetical protein ACIA5C_36145 [Actinoplanes sp. NPDC051343]|uniref:hypothetical protein n=1 Tax=Actinoplanes sp. NPDC051343 TaxID=3363906 RepID=UPI0037BB665B
MPDMFFLSASGPEPVRSLQESLGTERILWTGRCAVAEYAFDEPASLPRWTLPEETGVVVTETRVVFVDPDGQAGGELHWLWPQHLRVQPGNRDTGRSATVTQIQLVCNGPGGTFPALVVAGGDLATVGDADRLANALRQSIARFRVEHSGELGLAAPQTRMLSRLVIGPEFNNYQGGEGQTVSLLGSMEVEGPIRTGPALEVDSLSPGAGWGQEPFLDEYLPEGRPGYDAYAAYAGEPQAAGGYPSEQGSTGFAAVEGGFPMSPQGGAQPGYPDYAGGQGDYAGAGGHANGPGDYPGGQAAYPAEQRGYADAQGRNPGQPDGHPIEQGGYPSEQNGYPAERGGYGAGQSGYPAEHGEHPGGQSGYPAEHGEHPGGQGGYPAEHGQHPGGLDGYAAEHGGQAGGQGDYPGDRGGYAAGQRPAAYEPHPYADYQPAPQPIPAPHPLPAARPVRAPEPEYTDLASRAADLAARVASLVSANAGAEQSLERYETQTTNLSSFLAEGDNGPAADDRAEAARRTAARFAGNSARTRATGQRPVGDDQGTRPRNA